MNLESAIVYFEKNEGIVPHMYQDTAGLVTCGVGLMLPDAVSAQAPLFVVRATGELASVYQKSLEWQAVHAQEKGHIASYYQQFTTLDLPDEQINQLLVTKISSFQANLTQRFPKFSEFPDSVQLGLMDMVYSLGALGLFRGYPKFCAAVDAEGWAICAAECARGGVSESRNDDCAALFKSQITEGTPT